MAQLVSLPGEKRAYVVGLAWRHEDAVPKQKAMRALAAEKGRWGVVATTSAGGVQAGFCEPPEGAETSSKVRALAAVVADAHPQPWNGIFDIGHGRFWYIAVRDGQQVIPDGDQVGSREQMEAARDQHRAYGAWDEHDGTLSELSEIAQGTPRQPAMRHYGPASVSTRRLASVVGAAVLVVAGSGFAWRWHLQQVEAERLAELARARAGQVAAPVVFPWATQPMPSDALDACQREWNAQTLADRGWVLATWRCALDAQGVTVDSTWARDGGLADAAPGTVDQTGDKATHSATWPLTWPRLSRQALTAEPARLAALTFAQVNGLTQGNGAFLELVAVPPPAAPPGSNSAPPPAPPWAQATATIDKLEAPPWMRLDSGALDDVIGLRFTDMSYNGTVWKLSGAVYSVTASGSAAD